MKLRFVFSISIDNILSFMYNKATIMWEKAENMNYAKRILVRLISNRLFPKHETFCKCQKGVVGAMLLCYIIMRMRMKNRHVMRVGRQRTKTLSVRTTITKKPRFALNFPTLNSQFTHTYTHIRTYTHTHTHTYTHIHTYTQTYMCEMAESFN